MNKYADFFFFFFLHFDGVIFVKSSNVTTLFGSFLWKFDTLVGVKIHPADTPVGVKIHPADPSPLPVPYLYPFRGKHTGIETCTGEQVQGLPVLQNKSDLIYKWNWFTSHASYNKTA